MICNKCDLEMGLDIRKNIQDPCKSGYICDGCFLQEVKEKWITLDKEGIAKIRRRIEEKLRKNQELIPILAIQLNIQMDDVLKKKWC